MEQDKKTKKQYSKEIEAAWYAISKFISSFDYVVRYTDKHYKKQTKTVNPNCVIAAQISKNNLFKPISIGKYMLQEHFNRDTILFYKCATNIKLSNGFGKYDKDALSLPFSLDLTITTKKHTDNTYYVLLIGIDIDCHNGEKHVKEVEELIKLYLPNTYWEDSTNGKGRHGYLKIKFLNSFGVIETISDYLKRLFNELNTIKNLHGYEANIDEPAGLPYKLEFKDTNPYHKEWTTLFYKSGKENKFLGRHINPKSKIWKNYMYYLRNNTIYHISANCDAHPNELVKCLSDKNIEDTYSKFLSDNDISFSAPTKNNKYYKITTQRAFKLPMFGATTSDDADAIPTMACIKEFHSLPYYTSSELKTAYNLIWSDIKNFTNSSNISCKSDSDYFDIIPSNSNTCLDSENDAYTFPILIKEENKASSTHSRCSFVSETSNTTETVNISSIKEKNKERSNNCACTNTLKNTENSIIDISETYDNNHNYAEFIEWSKIDSNNGEEFDIVKYWDNYKHNKRECRTSKYEEILVVLKYETDTMKKTALFIPAYINKQGRIPTVDEAEKEYVSQKLNNNSADSSQNRRNRFKSCIGYYADRYDQGKNGFSHSWGKDKEEVINLMTLRLPDDLQYKQGNRVKIITHEEIGYFYQIIKKMGNSEQNYVLANSLSYAQADELFIKEFGIKCGRHKFSGIIKILLGGSLIEKCANYKVGLRGNCYQVKND